MFGKSWMKTPRLRPDSGSACLEVRNFKLSDLIVLLLFTIPGSLHEMLSRIFADSAFLSFLSSRLC